MKWLIPLLVCLLVVGCKQKNTKTETHVETLLIPAGTQPLYDEVARYPDSIALRIRLVNTLDSMGALPLALIQMDSLIARDSTNYGIWFHKAQLSEKAGDTTMALSSYEKAARVYPAPDALLSMANLYAEKGHNRSVILSDEVEKLRLGREYLAHCSFIKGVYYARTGDLVKALASFDRCIGNDYQYMEAYMEKGFLLFEHGQVHKAIDVFHTVIKVRPTYADAFYWLGKCYEKNKDEEKAIHYYQQSLVLDPGIKEADAALKRMEAK